MSGRVLKRRDLLRAAGGLSAGAILGFTPRRMRPPINAFGPVRLCLPDEPHPTVHAAARDAAWLLGQALGEAVEVVLGGGASSPSDWQLTVATSFATASNRQADTAGAWVVSRDPPGPLVIVGYDAEGCRDGLYALLRALGFGFFRDGVTFPHRQRLALPRADCLSGQPHFLLRGEMLWDAYLGPRRQCVATWGEAEWERALLFMARCGHNFCEFYPPLEAITNRAFPDLARPLQGTVWEAEAKLDLAQRVLQRGRELGIRFMYIIEYGHFPGPVRAHFPELNWSGGFICGEGDALPQLSGQVWGQLIETLGTDHLYGLRHRGEEGQSYANPCRARPKVEGYAEGIGVLRRLDPQADITVWSWGEEGDVLNALPDDITVAHVRHGVGQVFSAAPVGRSQGDGPPQLAVKRPWLSAQFTVFGGWEASLRTAWSNPEALIADARAAAADPMCRGYYQWPEWSDTSPWLSHLVAELAQDPGGVLAADALSRYAAARHGDDSEAFLQALGPLLLAPNAPYLITPQKRPLLPLFLAPSEWALLTEVRRGMGTAAAELSRPRLLASRRRISALLARDLGDGLVWLAVRQAHALETAAWLKSQGDASAGGELLASRAVSTWAALEAYLAATPERSVAHAARMMAAERPLSPRALKTFMVKAFSFYKGYPSMISLESVRYIYRPQSEALAQRLKSGVGEPLEEAGWLWRDEVDPALVDGARRLPEVEGWEAALSAVLSEALAAPADGAHPPRSSLEGAWRHQPRWAPASEGEALVAALLAVVGIPLA